jgi:hypothetical protein
MEPTSSVTSLSSGLATTFLLVAFCLVSGCGPETGLLGGDDDDSVTPGSCAGRDAGAVALSSEELYLDWWEGQALPVESLSVTIEVPECAHLDVQTEAAWLSASLSAGELTVSLNELQVVSGRHVAEVLLWDLDRQTAAATLRVNLDALVRPVVESSRNVLVIGVDGLDGDELGDIDVPMMEQLMERGLWSFAANTQLSGATSSGPGWTSILSGVETEVHNVTHNGDYGSRNSDYPSFLSRARSELGLSTAAAIQWGDIWDILEGDAADASGSGDMREVADAMNDLLRGGEHQVHFIHLDDVDIAGHSAGFLADEAQYYAAVQEVDDMIREAVGAILERPGLETEHWLVVVTSDHGGDAGGTHGALGSNYQTIPLLIAAPGLSAVQIPDGLGSHLDVHATVIDFLGLNPDGYGLAGASWWQREWEQDCGDGLDDDGDGYIDCADSDCGIVSLCIEQQCSDGLDDDGDGLFDCDDPDCATDNACMECPLTDLGQATGTELIASVPFLESRLTGSCGGEGPESSYAWTAPQSGRYSFDTVGGGRDTVLYALAGDCQGEELACNEDVPDLGGGRSALSLDLVGGESVVVVVDSFSNSDGGASVLSIHPFTSSCPDGDLGDATGTSSGSHVSFDQAHQSACPPAVGNLEFTWTAPEAGTYTYSTAGSDFDTVIYVLDGCGGVELACNDDATGLQSELSFSALAGEQFVLGLGGFNSAQGTYEITIE